MDIVTGVGVLDKAVHILRAVADGPRTLHSLQTATGLPRATAHRLAVALEAHGLLRRDDEGRFDLGPELAALGRITSERYPLAELALPALAALRDDTEESVQLFVREGTHRRCVLSLQSPHALRWIVPEEREAGVASVSAPVRTVDGVVVAAVSVSGPIDRLTRSPGVRFGDRVVRTADAVAAIVAR